MIDWADIILAMEAIHKRRLGERFPTLLKHRKVVVLGVPDNYEFMSELLVTTLKENVVRHLKV